MLLKLFKHDFKACARYEVPVLFAILGATLIGCIEVFIMSMSMKKDDMSALGGIGTVTGTLGLMLVVISFAVAATVMTVMLYLRFYKSMVTDEAYLTLTLPVSPSAIIWAKLLSAMLWSFIASLAIILAGCILVFCAFAFSGALADLPNPAEVFSQLPIDVVTVIIFILLSVVTLAESFLQVYMAILFGGSVVRKNKALAAVGMVFAINFATNTVLSIVSAFTNYGYLGFISNTAAVTGSINGFLLIQLGLYAVLAVVFFLITHYFVSKKVNLE